MNVTLRPYQLNDTMTIATLANNPAVSRYLHNDFPYPYPLETARKLVEHMLTVSISERIEFVIDVDQQFAGAIGVTFSKDIYKTTATLGYWLGEPYWHQGIMQQVIKTFIPYIFTNLSIHKMVAEVFRANIASQKLLLKNGFLQEGVLKEHVYKYQQYHDIILYGLLNK